MRLQRNVVIVSGAARGIGAAEARAPVEQGARVVIGDQLDDLGRTLASELNAGRPNRCAQYLHLNATRMADWEHAVRLAEASFGRLTTLVNNAGTLTAVTADDDTVQLTSQSITSVRAGISELLSDCGRAANRICNRRLSGDGQETETLIFGGCTEEQTFHRDRAQGKRHLDPPDVLP